jgi:hypothetical protein
MSRTPIWLRSEDETNPNGARSTTVNVAEVLAKPISEQLLTSHVPARFAYTGVDGDPRVVPVGFLWTGTELKVYTVPTSAKVKALAKNPRVAITIDTEGFPPHVLLIRGAATLELVDGVPDGYVEATRKLVAPEQMAAWEAGVRQLYQQMTVITVMPDWAKLLDFETTLPKAVEELVKAYGDPR